MTNWKSISSAPKDGSMILFADKYKQIGICWWESKCSEEGWNSDSCESFGGFEYPLVWDYLPEFPEEYEHLTETGVA